MMDCPYHSDNAYARWFHSSLEISSQIDVSHLAFVSGGFLSASVSFSALLMKEREAEDFCCPRLFLRLIQFCEQVWLYCHVPVALYLRPAS